MDGEIMNKVQLTFTALLLTVLILTACSAPTDKLDQNVLLIIFDGYTCDYRGPSSIKPGPVTLVFLNKGEEEMSSANLAKHMGDETIQDAIDHIGEEPSYKHSPSWAEDIRGVWYGVFPGDFHIWEGELEPGTYSMFCAINQPFSSWYAAGLIVEE